MPLVTKARKIDPVLRGVTSKFTKYEQEIYNIYVRALSQMPKDLDNDLVRRAIREAIEAGNPMDGAFGFQWNNFLGSLDKSIPTLANQLAASANISAKALPKAIQISSSFTATDPRAIAWAQQRAGARILGITQESQKAVAETITRGLQGQLTRDEVIEGVTRVVGLDSRQAKALGTFYEKNLNLLLEQGLTYENAARAAKKLGERYRSRLIKQRATRIARTETNAAANAGRMLSWAEADLQGLLPAGSEKRWKTSQDERNCPTCRPMHNETVPWEGAFSTGDIMPPVHINCLCTAVIVPADAVYEKSLHMQVKKTSRNAWLFVKHGTHNQKTHAGKGGGGDSTRELLVTQASQYETFDEFSNAISLQGLRPKVWHIADEGFELDPDYKPTNRLGGTSSESGLFVGDPETWQDYAVGRSTVIEYDVTDLSLTTKPLADTSADFFPDQSGNQGFFVRPSAFSRLKEVKRMPIAEALSRAKKQQDSMPKSKAEARQIWEESRSVNKHGSHNQKTHGRGGSGRESVSGGEVTEFDESQMKELDARQKALYQASAEFREKNNLGDFFSTRGDEFQALPAETRKEYEALDDEIDEVIAGKQELQARFVEESLKMTGGGSPSDSDFGLEGEGLSDIRDEWVVDANGSTLKTNASLRRTGRVTTKVQRFDELVEQGTIARPARLYRGAVLSESQVAELEVGKTIVDRGFQSTGFQRDTAQFYLNDRTREITGTAVMFDYVVEPGVNAVNVGYGEIVLQRGASVTVTAKTVVDGITVIQASVTK